MRLPPLLLAGPLLFAFLQLASANFFTSSSSSILFCKCLCFQTNSTIIPLYLPKDPLHPCLTCTRQFCLDQKLPGCVGAEVGGGDLDTGNGEGGDVEARCFERDSPKSHFLVILFILVTSTLLFGALLKQYGGVDLQGTWGRDGVRGVINDLVLFVRQLSNRRRTAQQYSTVEA